VIEQGLHRSEISIRRAVEAAIRDHHAERRQHVEIAPEPLAADRVEDEVGVMPSRLTSPAA
jgi:hypothetical protein